MNINKLRSLVLDDFNRVNQLIIEKIQSQIGLIDELSHHIINSGGKRLRPLLVLISSRACGYEGSMHIPLAAMIEFFHTATLLHDDVVDESTLRRGQETANEIWGSKASILVGDYLFTQSVQLMVEANNTAILRLLADTSHQISCGEVKQLANRHNPAPSITEYFDVIRCKTALLFAASTTIGPLLANTEPPIEKALYDYGYHLGNAFQLKDDALDYTGNVHDIGKNIGGDLADGKATMPLLYALEKGTLEEKTLIQDSLKEGGKDNLDRILHVIKNTQAIEFTQKLAAEEINKALAAIHVVQPSPYKEALIEIAESSLQRIH